MEKHSLPSGQKQTYPPPSAPGLETQSESVPSRWPLNSLPEHLYPWRAPPPPPSPPVICSVVKSPGSFSSRPTGVFPPVPEAPLIYCSQGGLCHAPTWSQPALPPASSPHKLSLFFLRVAGHSVPPCIPQGSSAGGHEDFGPPPRPTRPPETAGSSAEARAFHAGSISSACLSLKGQRFNKHL